MEYRIEEIGTYGRELHLTFEVDDLDQRVNKKLSKMANTVEIKGFRPGKIPAKVLKSYYGNDLKHQAQEELIEENYKEIVNEHSMHLLTESTVGAIENNEKGGFNCTVYMEIMPTDMKLNTLDGVEIEKPIAEISEADVDTMLERIKGKHKTWRDKTGPAAIGDKIILEPIASEDAALLQSKNFISDKSVATPLADVYESGKLQYKSFILDESASSSDFAKQFETMSVGETMEMPLNYERNDENADPAAAGPTLRRCRVRIASIAEPVLPSDDEFLSIIGLDKGGLDEFRQMLRSNMELELSENLSRIIQERVCDAMLKHNKIEISQNMLNYQLRSLRDEAAKRYSGKISKEKIMQDKSLVARAESQVRLHILLLYFANMFSIQITSQDCEALISKMASAYEDPAKVAEHYRDDQQEFSNIKYRVLSAKVLENLFKRMTVREKQYSFFDILQL